MKVTISRSILSIIMILFFSVMFIGSNGASGDCFVCDGSGKNDCVVCVNGRTEYNNSTCTFCNGNGKTTCTICNGSGKSK